MLPSGLATMPVVMTGRGIRPGTIPVMAGMILGIMAVGAGTIPGTMVMDGIHLGTIPGIHLIMGGMIPGTMVTAGTLPGITPGMVSVALALVMRTLSVQVQSVVTVWLMPTIAEQALRLVTQTVVV